MVYNFFSIVVALKAILFTHCTRGRPSLSLDALRLKFGQETGMIVTRLFDSSLGVSFGHIDRGSLLDFLKQYPHIFKVHVSKNKKHHNSQASLINETRKN